jgi:hypothetical protein
LNIVASIHPFISEALAGRVSMRLEAKRAFDTGCSGERPRAE